MDFILFTTDELNSHHATLKSYRLSMVDKDMMEWHRANNLIHFIEDEIRERARQNPISVEEFLGIVLH